MLLSFGDALALVHKFNPNQERDEHGRWTFAGGERDSPLTGEERVMYHGTARQYLDSIREKGLVTNPTKRNFKEGAYYEGSRGETVFVTHDEDIAKIYADTTAKESGGKPLILQIHIPGDQAARLQSDEHDDNGYKFPATIPPQWIYYGGGPLKKADPVPFYHVVVVVRCGVDKFDPNEGRDDHGRWTAGLAETAVAAQSQSAGIPLFNLPDDDTPEQRKAIDSYTDVAYGTINRGLWNGDVPDAEKPTLAALDELAAKTTVKRDFVVHRGGHDWDRSGWDDAQVGSTIKLKTFVSTSFSEHHAIHGFMADDQTGVLYHILVPKGAHAIPVDGFGGGSDEGENEVILPRDSSFTIDKIKPQTKEVWLRMVP